MSFANAQLEAPAHQATFAEWVARPGYVDRCAQIAARVTTAPNSEAIQHLLSESVNALGAESGVLLSIVRREQKTSAASVVLACNPHWASCYLQHGGAVRDPWLDAALRHAQPMIAPTKAFAVAQQQMIDAMRELGFASTLIAAGQAGTGVSRQTVLYLGSSREGYFDAGDLTPAKLAMRMLVCEFQDWWLARTRRQLLERIQLKLEDVELLKYELAGLTSKEIADRLRISKTAVDSRFQRLHRRIGSESRRDMAQLVADCGLLNP